MAYDIFFNKKSESITDHRVIFCQAIRYGRIGTNYLMESYTGSGLGRDITFSECVQLFPETFPGTETKNETNTNPKPR